MNFVKRGLISIKRRIGKSVILLILVFVLGNIIAGAISIRQAVKNTEINMRKKIGAVASVELDYDRMYKENNNFDYESLEYINAESIQKIGSLPYIQYYDYSLSCGLTANDLKRYYSETREGQMYQDEYQKEYFSLSGVNYAEILDFKTEKAKLVLGRVFTEEEIKSGTNVAIISDKLAEKNNLNLGSIIKFQNTVYKPMNYETGVKEIAVADVVYEPEILAVQDLEYEVIGIFETAKEVQKDEEGQINFDYINEEKQNKIYVTNQSVRKINNFTTTEIRNYDSSLVNEKQYEYLVPLFILNDPMDLEKFKEEAQAYLPEYYRVSDNGEKFAQIAAPMKNMEWIAQIVLYVAIGATIVILSLLITLFLRDRKHEIGIYLSLGEKKKRVIMQIVLEVVIVSVIGITASLFSGNILANSMSKTMLKNQIVAEEEQKLGGYRICFNYL